MLNSPIPDCNLYVELINFAGDIIDKEILWAQHGLAYGDFQLPDTISSGVYQLRAYTNWMRNFDDCCFFCKNIVIRNLRDKLIQTEFAELKSKDIDLQFFHEGGTLDTNVSNKVAFKAIDQNGKGIPLKVKLLLTKGTGLLISKAVIKAWEVLFLSRRKEENTRFLQPLTIILR